MIAGIAWLLADIGADGRWRPGIGDPTPLGWLTVFAYAAAAGYCVRAARRDHFAMGEGSWSGARSKPLFWWTLTLVLVLLGVNKQLDLQSWVTQAGRDLARSQGWYDRRQAVQRLFVGAVGVVSLAVLVVGIGLARGSRARVAAVVGLAVLLGFVLIRASSWHRVDALLGLRLGGLPVLNAVLELGGVAVIGGAAASLRGVPHGRANVS